MLLSAAVERSAPTRQRCAQRPTLRSEDDGEDGDEGDAAVANDEDNNDRDEAVADEADDERSRRAC